MTEHTNRVPQHPLLLKPGRILSPSNGTRRILLVLQHVHVDHHGIIVRAINNPVPVNTARKAKGRRLVLRFALVLLEPDVFQAIELVQQLFSIGDAVDNTFAELVAGELMQKSRL